MLVENPSHPLSPAPAGRNIENRFHIPPRRGWVNLESIIATNILPRWGCSMLSGKINNGKNFAPPPKPQFPHNTESYPRFFRSPTATPAMQVKFTLTSLIFFLTFSALYAQVAKDATVPVAATVSTGTPGITLNWSNPSASSLFIQRRTKGQTGFQWTTLLNVTNSAQTSLTDNNVEIGQTYEYYVKRTTNIVAHGYAQVAVEAPPTDSRGKLLLFVDADIIVPLAAELERLRDDLAGDGWQIIEHVSDASSTVQSVKDQILADYNTDPDNVKSVFLLGKIPIPYSGNAAWDGHTPDHTGAWPCDAYYAELNGTWTDVSINNTVPTRDANDNVPGDGKFDNSTLPSRVELQVGRVDFRRLTEGTFGTTTVELLRRYLDKDHNWRTGLYLVENKALVDDNFFYFGGEAFAANGFRNAYPLVGEANIVEADFFNDTNPQTYLMGYGTGGGSYTSAGGVGNSTNFATDTVHIVFSNLFGSYHGDWDYETNPFMPSALASQGGILTCSWAGRPHHFYQALASGETIGYCMKETQNGVYNTGYFASISGEGGVHTALLGDPTIRAHIVAPATGLTALAYCGKVPLGWTASADTAVSGYHVYRSTEQYGAYTRLTINAVTGVSFTDDNAAAGTFYYQVRAIKKQTSPGGGIYWNNSTGIIIPVEVPPFTPLKIEIAGILDCDFTGEISANVSGGTPPYQYLWSTGDTTAATTIPVGAPIALTVTDAEGCSITTGNIVIAQPPALIIDADISNESTPGANDGSIDLTLTGGNPPFIYLWSNGATTKNLTNIPGGIYFVTVTDANGCTFTEEVEVQTVVGTKEATLFQQLLLSPNPTGGLAMFFLKLYKSAPVRVEVHDVAGNRVWEFEETTLIEAQIPIDIREKPPGIYSLFVFVENEVFVRKLAVIP